MTTVREAAAQDVSAMEDVLRQTELFPPEMLADMMAEEGGLWHVAESAGGVVGFSFTREEPMAEGCWNMLALGVAADARRSGAARALTQAVEADVLAAGARVVIVDTSSGPEFEGARLFYAAAGYAEEARIRDYWGAGDHKITYRKAL